MIFNVNLFILIFSKSSWTTAWYKLNDCNKFFLIIFIWVFFSQGFGDYVYRGTHQGCAELLATVRDRVKPKFHIFGHIHEGWLKIAF